MEDQNYKLGDDITAIFTAKLKKETVVLSVRIPVGDMIRLEQIATAERRTPSQVMRDALALYTPFAAFGNPQTWASGSSQNIVFGQSDG